MGVARFTAITPECLRLEYSPAGQAGLVNAPTLLAAARGCAACAGPEDIGPVSVVVHPDSSERVLDTGTVRLRYAPDGRAFHPGNLRIEVLPKEGFEGALWRPGDLPRENLGGALRTLDGVRRAVPLADGILTSDGWYVLDDSAGYIIQEDGWVRPRGRENGGAIDWYFFGYGRDFKAAMRALLAVSGPAPLPRRVMLGSWYSRFWPHTSDDYRAIVEEYDFHGFPLDIVVMDMDWHQEGWTGWSWNRQLLPDAGRLLQWLHGRGLEVTLNLHPADGVGPHEDRYAAFMKTLGKDPLSGETIPFDAGDRRYMEALFEEVLEPLEEPEGQRAGGVDFWWVDWQQEEFVRSLPGLSNLAWLNHLFHRHTARRGRRGAAFSRWGGWGDHRHPIHFSGDTHTGWASLAFQVPFTAASSNSGCFYWSHDIGGHFGARDEECLTRWVQFGALSAALRIHAARSRALDRRPWAAHRPFEGAMRRAYLLRSRLMPYIYTQAERCYADGLPLIRPMYLEFPSEPAAYRSPQQYLLGDHLLVAPVVSPGLGSRRVGVQNAWFPPHAGNGAEPARWFDFFTGERYTPGSEAVVAAEIEEIPLYVRGGVPIPMRPPTLRMGTEPLDRLTVRLFPGPPGSVAESELYEDDGETMGYQRGESAITPLVAQWSSGRLKLLIGPTQGEFAGQPRQREIDVELGAIEDAEGAWVNGHAAAVGFEPEERGVHVHVPPLDIRQPVTVEIAFSEPDYRRLAERNRRRRLADSLDRPVPEASLHAAVRRIIREAETDAAAQTPVDTVLAISAGIAVRPEQAGFRLHDSLGMLDEGRAEVAVIDRVGAEEAVVHESVLTIPPRGSARIEEGPSPVPDPPLGLRAGRDVQVSFAVRGDKARFRTQLRTRLTPVRAWLMTGPFPFDWTGNIADQRHGPETGPLEASARYRGRDGIEVGWVRAVATATWAADVRATLGPLWAQSGGWVPAGLAYTVTRIRSPRAQQAVLELESGDRLEAWVNGDKVFSLDTGETMDSARGTARIVLNEGWNRIMVKVSEGGGGWGFTGAIAGEVPVEESAEP